MDFYTNLFCESISDSVRDNTLALTYGAHNYKLFKNEEEFLVQSHINKINSSLYSIEKRSSNLSLLLTVLPQCCPTLLTDNGDKWVRLCSQNLNSNLETTDKIASLKILSYIFKKCKENQQLRQKIFNADHNFLYNLYTDESQEEVIIASFECLYEFVCQFPGETFLFKQKNTIKDYLFSFLNSSLSSNTTQVKWAARIYWSLPVQKINGSEKEEREKQVIHFVSLIHDTLTHIFKGVKDDQNPNASHHYSSFLNDLFTKKMDPIKEKLTANIIVSNSLIFLGQFFSSCSTQDISLPGNIFLSIIFRILQVEVEMLNKRKGQEMTLLALLLPNLHACVLGFTNDLLESNCKTNNFDELIVEQLFATIKSTYQPLKNKQNEKKKQGELVRSKAYEVFAALIQASNGRSKIPQELSKFLIDDITISSDKFVFQKAKPNEAKKSKKKGFSGTIDGSTQAKLDSSAINNKISVAKAALKLIDALFHHCVTKMSNKMVKDLEQNLLKCSLNPFSEVYLCPIVRGLLYKCVISYALHPHPMFLVSYQNVIRILDNGMMDCNPQVKAICQGGLATISVMQANPKLTAMSDLLHLSNVQATTNGLQGVESDEEDEDESMDELENDSIILEDDIIQELSESDTDDSVIEIIDNNSDIIEIDPVSDSEQLENISEHEDSSSVTGINQSVEEVVISESLEEYTQNVLNSESLSEHSDEEVLNSELLSEYSDEEVLNIDNDSGTSIVNETSIDKRIRPRRVVTKELLKKRKVTPFKSTLKRQKLNPDDDDTTKNVSIEDMMSSLVE